MTFPRYVNRASGVAPWPEPITLKYDFRYSTETEPETPALPTDPCSA